MTQRSRCKIASAVVVAMVVTGALAVAPAHASDSKSSSSTTASSIALSNADPSFGGTVSFAVTYPSMKWIPAISVTCTQNGQQVYMNVNTQLESNWTQFTLWSWSWAASGGGAANCVSSLYYYTTQGKTVTGIVYLATTSFTTT